MVSDSLFSWTGDVCSNLSVDDSVRPLSMFVFSWTVLSWGVIQRQDSACITRPQPSFPLSAVNMKDYTGCGGAPHKRGSGILHTEFDS